MVTAYATRTRPGRVAHPNPRPPLSKSSTLPPASLPTSPSSSRKLSRVSRARQALAIAAARPQIATAMPAIVRRSNGRWSARPRMRAACCAMCSYFLGPTFFLVARVLSGWVRFNPLGTCAADDGEQEAHWLSRAIPWIGRGVKNNGLIQKME